jgi:hypothetical protein
MSACEPVLAGRRQNMVNRELMANCRHSEKKRFFSEWRDSHVSASFLTFNGHGLKISVDGSV